jgi:hypothetical protein
MNMTKNHIRQDFESHLSKNPGVYRWGMLQFRNVVRAKSHDSNEKGILYNPERRYSIGAVFAAFLVQEPHQL